MRLSAIVLSVIHGTLPVVPQSLVQGTRSIIKGLFSEVVSTIENKRAAAPIFRFSSLALNDNDTMLQRLILQRVADKINQSSLPTTALVHVVYSSSTTPEFPQINLTAINSSGVGFYTKNIVHRPLNLQLPDEMLNTLESSVGLIFNKAQQTLTDHPHSNLIYAIALPHHKPDDTTTALQSLIAEQVAIQINSNLTSGFIAHTEVIQTFENTPTVVALSVVSVADSN